MDLVCLPALVCLCHLSTWEGSRFILIAADRADHLIT